jgi:hypothetical protein
MVLTLDADPVHLVCKGDVEYFGEAGLLFQVYIVCFLWTVIEHDRLVDLHWV